MTAELARNRRAGRPKHRVGYVRYGKPLFSSQLRVTAVFGISWQALSGKLFVRHESGAGSPIVLPVLSDSNLSAAGLPKLSDSTGGKLHSVLM